MKKTGKIMATSFLAGAAAALYASKHMNKENTTTAKENNTYEINITPQTSNTKVNSQTTDGSWNTNKSTTQTTAQKSNSFTKASPSGIDYSYDAGATTTTQPPYNIYFENKENPQFAGNIPSSNISSGTNNTDSTGTNGNTGYSNPNTTIKIDAR